MVVCAGSVYLTRPKCHGAVNGSHYTSSTDEARRSSLGTARKPMVIHLTAVNIRFQFTVKSFT